jgi:hypothetical protein
VIDGVWLLIGIGILVYMRVRGREQWLATAGRSLADIEPGTAGDAA